MPVGEMVSEERKLDFLDWYREGHSITRSALEAGLHPKRIYALRNPRCRHYDEAFDRMFNEIEEEHDQAQLERLRDATFERALESSDRLAAMYLIAKDPQFAYMKTQRVEINASIESFVQEHFKALPAQEIRELLQRLKTAEEQEGPRALEAA